MQVDAVISSLKPEWAAKDYHLIVSTRAPALRLLLM